MKSTPEQIRQRFDNDVERFSNLETGQSATMDAPLVLELITSAAAATNPDARDFRLESFGPKWKSSPLQGQNGMYEISMPGPGQGWTAFFVELTFLGPQDVPLVFSTEVVVTPDVYPFEASWQAARLRR